MFPANADNSSRAKRPGHARTELSKQEQQQRRRGPPLRKSGMAHTHPSRDGQQTTTSVFCGVYVFFVVFLCFLYFSYFW